MKISAIITAGGTSSRYGKTNKLLEKINNKFVIQYTIEKFLEVEQIHQIVICANPSILNDLEEIFNHPKIIVIKGGITRQDSVYNGLKICDCDYVIIHDGARPLISSTTITKAIENVQIQKALTVAVKCTDTIKQVKDGVIEATLDRSVLYNTQTPQAFKYDLIKSAHELLKGKNFTDDAGMIEKWGSPVYILEGDYSNIKITTQADLAVLKVYLEEK